MEKYRTFKTSMGHKIQVKMTEQEIIERDLFRLLLLVIPTAMIWAFAWAAGMCEMAKLRTDEEKAAILEHCLDLEASGGDILGYLWSQDYITPRATWCNYQREWLGRKPYEFTDGKPKRKKGDAYRMKKAKVTLEHKKKAVQIAIDGGDPLKYLKDHGAGNPAAMWYTIKQNVKDTAPETFSKIPDLRAKASEPKTAEDAMTGMKDAADEFFGKCEEMGLKVNGEKVKKPSLTVSGPITVSAIRHKNFGEFYHDYDHNCIDWRTPEGDEVSLSVPGWKNLIEELPGLFKMLGVEM